MVKKFAYCLTINNPKEDDWLPFKDIDGAPMTESWTRTRPSFGDSGEVSYETTLPMETPNNKEYPKKGSFKEKHPLMYKNYIQYIIYGNEKVKLVLNTIRCLLSFEDQYLLDFVKGYSEGLILNQLGVALMKHPNIAKNKVAIILMATILTKPGP